MNVRPFVGPKDIRIPECYIYHGVMKPCLPPLSFLLWFLSVLGKPERSRELTENGALGTTLIGNV